MRRARGENENNTTSVAESLKLKEEELSECNCERREGEGRHLQNTAPVRENGPSFLPESESVFTLIEIDEWMCACARAGE